MNTLKNNPKYGKIFAALSTRTVDELKEQFLIMENMTMTPDRSLVKACTFEELESRIGEIEAGLFLDAMDLIAA